MKKSIAALALAGSIALIGAGSASAATPAPYPAPSTGTTVSATVVAPGGTITFSVASGFLPGETVAITVAYNGNPQAAGSTVNGGLSRSVPTIITIPADTVSDSFTVTANEQGGFSTPVTLGTEEGIYTITAVGMTSGYTVSQTVSVVDPAGTAAGAARVDTDGTSAAGLAETGADSGLVLWTFVGAGAVVAGVASVVVVRRRAKSGKTA